MTYATFLEFHSKYKIGSAIMEHNTRVPTWITYAIVPLGLGVMGLVLVGKLVRATQAGRNQ
jgi:TRAP-type C4-dicarboxylate transport system permease small subunit